MADDGHPSVRDRRLRPVRAKNSPHPTRPSRRRAAPAVDPSTAVLRAWDEPITRAARLTAARLGGGAFEADDLAQAARIRVWRLTTRIAVPPIPFLRRAIQHGLRSGARSERTRAQALTRHAEPLPDDLPAPPMQVPDGIREAVAGWVGAQPPRLRALYELLYVGGYTQREAAEALGVSQPRVAQLHRSLLQRGRVDLAHLAA